MDETNKPLRIPPVMAAYADTHHLSALLQELVSGLLLARPDDPISFLIRFLQRRSDDVPRVLLLGPPAVGKNTVARRLRARLAAVHVSARGVLEDQSELGAHSQQVEVGVVTSGEGVVMEEVTAPPAGSSDQLLLLLLLRRLKEVDCFNRGWVLEGFPRTRLQALDLQQAGIIPEHVVLLEAPPDVLQQRSDGRLFDPLTGDVYHQTFIRPADDLVAGRLQRGRGLSEQQLLAELHRHRCEVTGLKSAYQQVLKVVNGDQPPEDVYQQVLAFVQTRRRFRTPRILLFGPPGSGKSLQARLLSEKYKLVDVCCGQLLRSVAADGSRQGDLVQSYLDEGRAVPDFLVLQVLEDRLSRVDCSIRGWILHGFPRDLEQAQNLQERPLQPNRVFFLEVTDEVCVERVSLRATDPVSGQRFHAVTRPAPSSRVQDRLKTRPDDHTDTVTHNLQQYQVNTAVLKSMYPDAVLIDADQDPHSVFEALETQLTLN